MSDTAKRRLEVLGLILAIVTGTGGFLGAIILLPYRMAAAEKAINQVQVDRVSDRELLVRIDERGARTDARLIRIEQALDHARVTK